MNGQPLEHGLAQKRLEWKPLWDEFFVSLMVDEASKGRKVEKGFTRDSWQYMVTEFNKKFDQNLDHRQLKNRYKTFRREYKIVSVLLCQSGFSWDQSRKIVTAKPDLWDQYLLIHPKAKPYRTKRLPLFEEMHIIYRRTSADGRGLWSNNSVEVREKVDRVVAQTRLEWTPAWDEFFVSLMVDETNIARQVEQGFTQYSWRYMLSEFNKKFNQNLNHQQLKNRLKYLKKEFNVVSAILDQRGFGWDKSKKIVTADADVWDCYISAHSEAKPYRTKRLPLYEDMCIVFGKPSTDGRVLYSSNSVEPLEEIVRATGAVHSPATSVEQVDTPDAMKEDTLSNSREATDAGDEHNKRRFVMSTSSHQGKRMRKDTCEIMVEALHEMAEKAKFKASLMSRTDEQEGLKKCIEELMAMEGLDDDLFAEACIMLKDEKNAIIFMTLKGDRRLKWVKKMCE